MDRLFAEWQKRHFDKGNDYFNRDGIVNERIWKEQEKNKKICFFLKEAYQEDDHVWDLAKWLCNENGGDGAVKKMWHTVAELTYGLLNTTETSIPSYTEAKALTKSDKSDMLQRIAVVNVKKSAGKPQSKWADLIEYAQNDADLLRKQIDLIAPDIIVCGNNSSLLRIVYGASVDSENNVLDDGEMDKKTHDFMSKNGYVRFDNKLIIDFWHPANQFPKMMNFYTLCSIYQKALEKK